MEPLSRVLSKCPSQDTVKACGKIAPLLELGAGFHPELTGEENAELYGAILGMNAAEIREKLPAIVRSLMQLGVTVSDPGAAPPSQPTLPEPGLQTQPTPGHQPPPSTSTRPAVPHNLPRQLRRSERRKAPRLPGSARNLPFRNR